MGIPANYTVVRLEENWRVTPSVNSLYGIDVSDCRPLAAKPGRQYI